MKAVILDLDHTLVHAVHPKEDVLKEQAFTFTPAKKPYNVYKRPFLDEFMEFCFQTFDKVLIWSAGTEDYVEGILANCNIPILRKKKLFRIITRSTFNKHSKNISHILTHPELEESKIFFVDDKIDSIKGASALCHLVKAEPFRYYEYRGDSYLLYLQAYLSSLLKSMGE